VIKLPTDPAAYIELFSGPYNLLDGKVPRVGGVPQWPWHKDVARQRLEKVAKRLRLTLGGDEVLLESGSNDAWLLDDLVLRVCWRGDVDRFVREAELSAVLPEPVLGPKFLDHGRDEFLSWTVARRLRCGTLGDAWRTEPERVLRGYAEQLAGILQTLHAWRPNERIVRMLRAAEAPIVADPATIAAATLTPLALEHQLRLIDWARTMPFTDVSVLDRAAERLTAVQSRVRFEPKRQVFLHGDATPGNVYVRDGRVVGLLDYEWSRLGPLDAELALPGFWAGAQSPDSQERRRRLFAWLRKDYPELFDTPDLEDRHWLFRVSFALRTLAHWPPNAPETELDPWHPTRQLRALVNSRASLLA
jgi:hypothetical protein